MAVAGLFFVFAAGTWYLFFANRPAVVSTSPPAPVASSATVAAAKHLSIVVLPFKNLSGDPSQDYFADGVTDNLTTDLSLIRDSFVIASTTAFTYKGKTVDAKEIGKELGVRYVLEGSVQRDQGRVRVNAQLIDRKPARISGPNALRRTSPTCLSCKIRWWRDSPILWVTSSSRRKPKEARVPRTPTLSISRCAATPCSSCSR